MLVAISGCGIAEARGESARAEMSRLLHEGNGVYILKQTSAVQMYCLTFSSSETPSYTQSPTHNIFPCRLICRFVLLCISIVRCVEAKVTNLSFSNHPCQMSPHPTCKIPAHSTDRGGATMQGGIAVRLSSSSVMVTTYANVIHDLGGGDTLLQRPLATSFGSGSSMFGKNSEGWNQGPCLRSPGDRPQVRSSANGSCAQEMPGSRGTRP